MKQLKLTNEEVGSICLALANLYHAGIGLGDSLALLAEDEKDAGMQELLHASGERGGIGEKKLSLRKKERDEKHERAQTDYEKTKRSLAGKIADVLSQKKLTSSQLTSLSRLV